MYRLLFVFSARNTHLKLEEKETKTMPQRWREYIALYNNFVHAMQHDFMCGYIYVNSGLQKMNLFVIYKFTNKIKINYATKYVEFLTYFTHIILCIHYITSKTTIL